LLRRVRIEGLWGWRTSPGKVVGVGSVGTRAWIAVLFGRDGENPLFLRMKEAEASVLEDYVGNSEFRNHGERVVTGQRRMLGGQ
jgi:Uncharacterized protein conserved in bacteria (DUF2252)